MQGSSNCTEVTNTTSIKVSKPQEALNLLTARRSGPIHHHTDHSQVHPDAVPRHNKTQKRHSGNMKFTLLCFNIKLIIK